MYSTLRCAALGLFAISATLGRAVVLTEYFWVGNSSSTTASWETSGAWQGGAVPPDNSTAVIYFGYTPSYQITVGAAHTVGALEFREDGPFYTFSGNSIDALTIGLGLAIEEIYYPTAGELVGPASSGDYYYYGTRVRFASSLPLILAGPTTWDIPYSSGVEIAGPLNGTDILTKTGGGTLLISGANLASFFGDIHLADGILAIGGDTALGNGTVVLGSYYDGSPELLAHGGDRTISNAIEVADALQVGSYYQLNDHHSLTLSGDVYLRDNIYLSVFGSLLFFTGTITENPAHDGGVTVSVYSDSAVVFAGSSPVGFTGGLEVFQGAVVFLSGAALPVAPAENAFRAYYAGYVGLGDTSIPAQTFVDLFDSTGSYGTIGFDTDPLFSTPNVFSGAINLTGFESDVRLGTVTSAELSGIITPQGADYRFGGGGGELTVSSPLNDHVGDSTDLRNVVVDSVSGAPLLVRLTNPSNTFSGILSVRDAGVIITTAGAVPTTRLFELGYSGYLGIADATVTPAAFLTHFPTTQDGGIIGLDSTDRNTNRNITDPIDLAVFSEPAAPVYIGSATWVNLGGTITPAAGGDYYFAGYRGGRVNVTSVIADHGGSSAVIIGNTSITETHFHDDRMSSVGLDAANTYTGGTDLKMGELTIGHGGSLGSGPLTVSGGYIYDDYSENGYRATPTLRPTAALTLPNGIVLNSSLEIATNHALGLTGDITGEYGLYKSGPGTVTLSGDSDFTGGIYVSEGNLIANTDGALGSGPLGFGFSSTTLSATLNAANPQIGGLFDYETTSQVNLPNSGTVLTIAPTDDYDYAGTITGAGSVTINGTYGDGSQTFSGVNSYTGTTRIINGGTLIITNPNAIASSSSVIIDGGNLIPRTNGALNLNLSFGSSGAKLGGNGTLTFSNTLPIGSGSSIAPGESIGSLTLNGSVNWAAGGTYAFEFADGTSGGLIHDSLYVQQLNLTSTAASRFNITIGSVDSATLANFNTNSAQTWTLVSTGGLDFGSTFDPAIFHLSLDSTFTNTLGGGVFSVGRSGTSLALTFTPVPEPSTAALLLLGVGWLVVGAGRRRA